VAPADRRSGPRGGGAGQIPAVRAIEMRSAARWLIRRIALVGVLVAGAHSALTADEETTKPNPNDAALVARGKAIYAEHCAACHGANLEGQANWRSRLPNGRLPAPPHDASGH